MALTVDEVSKITTDVSLGRKLRVEGPEVEAMAENIRKDIEEMSKKGYVPMPVLEVPEQEPKDSPGA